MPYLCVGGDSDELSPIANVDTMFHAMKGPRQLVIYQDSRHAISGVPAATLVPYLPTLVADWMAARMADKPMASERWYVDSVGRVTKAPL